MDNNNGNMQMSEVPVPPEQVTFWNTAVGKAARAAIYLAISALVGSLIVAVTDNPAMFGLFTPLVNVALVLIKNLVDPNVKNV